jgi:hypothetical protein
MLASMSPTVGFACASAILRREGTVWDMGRA